MLEMRPTTQRPHPPATCGPLPLFPHLAARLWPPHRHPHGARSSLLPHGQGAGPEGVHWVPPPRPSWACPSAPLRVFFNVRNWRLLCVFLIMHYGTDKNHHQQFAMSSTTSVGPGSFTLWFWAGEFLDLRVWYFVACRINPTRLRVHDQRSAVSPAEGCPSISAPFWTQNQFHLPFQLCASRCTIEGASLCGRIGACLFGHLSLKCLHN